LPEIWILPGILAKLLLGAAAQKPFNSDLEHGGGGGQQLTSGCYSDSLDVWLAICMQPLGLLGPPEELSFGSCYCHHKPTPIQTDTDGGYIQTVTHTSQLQRFI
jgi:hypothetical protein